MTVRRRILQHGLELPRDHREDFTTCPHCRHKMEVDVWMATAHTLSMRPAFTRRVSVAVTSKCPKCGESSWVHEPMEEIADLDVPKSWKTAAKAQLTTELAEELTR